MIILTIRTDKPEAELGLFNDQLELGHKLWYAHRTLAETLNQNIEQLLQSHNKKLRQIDGLVVFQGPGSFTGLRIGITVANAMADSLKIPIVASQGTSWMSRGIARIMSGSSEKMVLPSYGATVHITKPKK
ncbi:MAG TPA: tRNA (adenosine(37)-N6)-threonylcarbamoyltransferase complex dimerization subunit type 1 TsaB [Candidatus Dormibacteraeota bacterium]|nr:tRNA (adenosine(37)-N6)-threonylcarbamoyltransferase complex dimerization subunit type 1 TsaB [Candidatus Dormibacteraeota bacterium]